METINYIEGLQPRSRPSFLLLVQADGSGIHRFMGASIPRVCHVSGAQPRANGKWSTTTYSITLAPGVRAIAGVMGWETGKFLEGICATSWTSLAARLGATEEVTRAFLSTWLPNTAAKLDADDAAIAALLG